MKDADGNIVRHDEFFAEGHTAPIFKSEFWERHISRNPDVTLPT